MSGISPVKSEAGAAECCAVFVCDLAPGLSREDLGLVLGHYGDIENLEQVNEPREEAALVEYARPASAEEAQNMLNHASLRHKTCRCLLGSSLDVIRQTMDTGQRLVIENVDPAIESRGLLDVCRLFGQVLDCKVELDEEDRSRGYGFAHFAEEADAAKARKFMESMQIGVSAIEVRAFEAKDAALFTGCSYGVSGGMKRPDTEFAAAHSSKDFGEAGIGSVLTEMDRSLMPSFKSLHTHHLEVIDGVPGKLERLKTLLQLYNPNQELQMIVIADLSNLRAISKLMGEVFEEGDFETVCFATSTADRQEAIGGFETGNTFALVLASDVAMREDFDMKKKATVLVNFDFPSTLQAYLQRVAKRSDSKTCAHGFFSPTVDKLLAVPLMAAMEEMDQEIPPGLVTCWTGADEPIDS